MNPAVRSVTLCLMAAACGNIEPRDGRIIGAIMPGLEDGTVIEVSEYVSAGFPFTAVINTFGSSSCTIPDGAKVGLGPAEATVTPYDLVPVDGETVCTADYAARPHPVELVFYTPGIARITARGRHAGGTVPGSSIVTVTLTVTVHDGATRVSSPLPRTSP